MFKNEIVSQVINYIESNIDNPITIETLATYSGFSRRYIQVIFKELMGMPIGQFVRNKRIMRAATLLRLTSTPVIEIAYQLQFDSQQSFTREFKKISGYTPSAYRKAKYWNLSLYKSPFLSNEKTPEPPLLCSLLGGVITGYQISYEEPIPCPRIIGEYRWENILRFKNKKMKDIWLLTEFSPCVRNSQSMNVKTAIGTLSFHNDNITTKYEYPHGVYAVFSFKGTRDEYHRRIKEIYYHILPFWGYNRGTGPDVECFHYVEGEDESIIFCDTYIPIQAHENENENMNDSQVA
ncbi:TPA: helix-turn-helix domain-containing protein [Escherichia coli]